jgi:opacity protein-like surface antigen
MSLHRFAFAAVFVCSTAAFSQSFEASVSGGETYINSASSNIGTVTTDPNSGTFQIKDGFRIALRMTLNQGRFFGHEIGYAYNHTSLDVPTSTGGGITLPGTTTQVQNTGLPAHQGFYDFLVYALPEGFHVRPFATGGVQFTSFSAPGSYSRETKYGINYGGGLKFKVKDPWGLRFDIRAYNMSKPFNNQLPNSNGRFILYEFGVGISFMM